MLRLRRIAGVFFVWCWLAGCCASPAHKIASDLSLPGVDGARHLPFRSPARVTVVVFISTDCPIANGYAPEIKRIVSEYSPRGVVFHLVHVDRDVSPEQARAHADEYGYTCSILLDTEHQLVQAIGATVTPEAAVIDANRELRYRGRIDDRYTDFGKKRLEPSQRDLRTALDAVLEGRAVPQPRTRAIGCYITTHAAAQVDAKTVDG